MIIVKIAGGLGNQMFQYALGRHLAIKNNSTLKLDISGFETYKLHNYSLNNFNVIESFANPLEGFILKKPIGKFTGTYVAESKISFCPEALNAGYSSYLDGYWQSEKYFLDIEDVIRGEFTLKNGFSEDMAKMVDRIKMAGESVCLHIRRGDYATNERTNKVHGLCPPEYYYQALEIMKNNIKDPKIFVFSDDIDWVKKNLGLDNFPVIYVSDSNTKMKNCEELMLMSLCKHNIIANSSFSWWGAWLNRNPNKIVIAPKRWFVDSSKENKDLILDSWIRI